MNEEQKKKVDELYKRHVDGVNGLLDETGSCDDNHSVLELEEVTFLFKMLGK